MLDQQFGEDTDFSRGVLSRWPDDEDAGRGDGIARHHRNEGPGGQIIFDQAIRKPGDAEPRRGGGSESGAVVCLEPSLRMNGDRLVAVDELPGFRSLHQCLMREQFVRSLGSAMLSDIGRACDELSMDRPDVTCEQIRIAEIADTYRTIEAFPDKIDEAITVARM